jgi:hypothetical protein
MDIGIKILGIFVPWNFQNGLFDLIGW